MSTKIRLTLPQHHPGQQAVVDHARRYNVVDCGRRWGKTILGEERAIRTALAGYPTGWFAPTYKYVTEVWRDLTRLLGPVLSARNASDLRMELITGGIIEVWSLTNPDAGRGRKYKRVVTDEAAMVPNLMEIWNAAIRPTLMDMNGDAYFLSTPKGRNGFWRMFQWGIDPEQREWAAWKMPTAANPFISQSEIGAMAADLPERVFQQEIMAEFIEDAGTVFRNIAACLHADPHPVVGHHRDHRVVMGVDWAKSQDFTAISVMCADCAQELALDRFNRIDYAFQRERLKVLSEHWGVSDILAESNAMGEPIIEQLQRDGLPVRGFQTTGTTKPPLIESLALAFEREEAQWLDDPVARMELEAYECTISPTTGRSQYNAPEGLHDDTVIARALANQARLLPLSSRVYVY